MKEQQRILLFTIVCVAIIIGWQWLSPPSQAPAPRVPPVTKTITPPTTTSTATPKVKAVTEQNDSQSGISKSQLPFTTQLLEGSINNHGVLTRLSLLKYKQGTTNKDQQLSHNNAPLVSMISKSKDGNAWQGKILWHSANQQISPILHMKSHRTAKGEQVFSLHRTLNNGLRLTLNITPSPKKYVLLYHFNIENSASHAINTGASFLMGMAQQEQQSSFFAPHIDMQSGMCAMGATGDNIERKLATDLKKGPWKDNGPTLWSGIDLQYFVLAALPTEGTGHQCTIGMHGKTLQVAFNLGNVTLRPGEQWNKDLYFYVGPKLNDQLTQVSPALNNVINYSIWGIPLGFFARPMLWILKIFHQWTYSWGLAIILLTFVVKLVLFPISYKSFVSMRRMQLLRPEIDKLKQRFPDDKERQQREQLKLFKEKGVNPLGGCLPMLLQMPVWFALYRMLWTSVDLYQQSFLWIPNLTVKESFPFLALALGLVTIVQQKLTPTATDSQQAKIMMFVMPIMLTVFMIPLPSGLVLYIFVNSVLTILQQLVINRLQPAEK